VALKNGINLTLILKLVKDIRKKVNIPIILMGYVNPVMQYGMNDSRKMRQKLASMGLSFRTFQWVLILKNTKKLFEIR
jgi:tryptophan synthase alpha chain